jgi:hypothetical protein
MPPFHDGPCSQELQMTDAEAKVMDIFRFYGVLPYQMLCLSWKIQQDLQAPLDRLIGKGFIVREGRHDGFHLTPLGYQALNPGTESAAHNSRPTV